jgi:hypothetical protein
VTDAYRAFLEGKIRLAREGGFDVDPSRMTTRSAKRRSRLE